MRQYFSINVILKTHFKSQIVQLILNNMTEIFHILRVLRSKMGMGHQQKWYLMSPFVVRKADLHAFKHFP